VDKYVIVGRVGRPHGIRGQIRVFLLTDWPERFQPGRSLYLEGAVDDRWVTVEDVSISGQMAIVKLRDVNSRADAEKLKNCDLKISADERPELDTDEYYLADLIGLRVQTESGDYIGEITDVLQNTAQDIYVVQNAGREYLIPAVKQFIRTVDIQKGVVIVDPVEGLLNNEN